MSVSHLITSVGPIRLLNKINLSNLSSFSSFKLDKNIWSPSYINLSQNKVNNWRTISNVKSTSPILNQGQLGTCVANTLSYLIDHITGKSLYMSRVAAQFKYNAVEKGLNPDVSDNNQMNEIFRLAAKSDYLSSQMYNTGAHLSLQILSCFNGLPTEKVWKYPQPWCVEFPAYITPYNDTNPLLNIDYTPKLHDSIFIKSFSYVNHYGIKSETYSPKYVSDEYTCNQHFMTVYQLYSQMNNADYSVYNPELRLKVLGYIYDLLTKSKHLGISFLVMSDFNKIDNTGIYEGKLDSPYSNTDYLGGHQVTCVGYITANNLSKILHITTLNEPGYLVCKNSWGVQWGHNGYFYVGINTYLRSRIKSDDDEEINVFQANAVTVDEVLIKNSQ